MVACAARVLAENSDLAVFGDPAPEIAAAGAQAIDLVAHGAQRGVLGASVAATGHRVGVLPAGQMLAQSRGGGLQFGAQIVDC